MYKLKYTEEAIKSLKVFIDSYKNSFIKLVNDSGIEFEDKIINNYIEIGNNLYKNIITKIELLLSKDILLGRNIEKSYISLKINSFKLFIYYDEDNTIRERIIRKIDFFKN